MRSLLLLGASFILATISLQAQSTFNPGIPAQGFNVFTKSAIRFSAGDTHGPVATGGDVILEGSTIVDMNYNGYYPFGLNDAANYGLVIGGRVWYKSGNRTQLNRGQLRIGSLAGSNLYQVNSSTTHTQVQLSAGAQDANPNIQSNSTMPLNSAHTGHGLNFAVAFNALQNYSSTINNYPATHGSSSAINFLPMPPITGGGSQTITLAAGKVNYLSLTGAQLTAMETSGITYNFSRMLDSTTIVVFNVTASGTYNWSPAAFGAISDNSMAEGRFILYNFPAASRINIVGGRSSIGMILAPGAAIYKTGGNNAAGTIVADTLSIEYGEVHYAPFAGSLPGNSTALPVEQLSLSGTSSQGVVTLNWSAAGLDAMSELSLERSFDGSLFKRCATLPNAASGVWRETPTQPAQVFYRLHASKSDAHRYSSVWRADLPAALRPLLASPNPFTTTITIRNLTAEADWELSDIRGSRLQSGRCAIDGQITSLGSLPAGTYFLRVRQPNEDVTFQILKK